MYHMLSFGCFLCKLSVCCYATVQNIAHVCIHYLLQNGKCKFASTNIGATDKGYKTVFKGFEHELQKAVAEIGPISIGMDASHGSFQQYKSGIYSEKLCSRSRLDHGVLVVGYGSQNGEDYWIVKNR